MILQNRLMARMKENFREGGYRVGTYMENGREMLAVSGATWYVLMPRTEAGNDLLALIVKHTGAMPGKAVVAQKENVQLMMEGELQKIGRDADMQMAERKDCLATPLYLGNYEIWQDEDGRCALYPPELTAICGPDDGYDVYMAPGMMRLEGIDGTVWVAETKCRGQQAEMLEHLSGYHWTALA